MSWRFYGGALLYPYAFIDILPFLARMWHHIAAHAAPTWSATAVYLSFLALQAVLAAFLPSIKIKGLPIPSQNNHQLEYKCNGIWAWYITLIVVAVLQFTGIFSLIKIIDQFGSIMTSAIISGNITALITYFGAKITKNTHRMSGNFFYDYFMGA